MNFISNIKNILKTIWGKNSKVKLLIIFSLIIVYGSSLGIVAVPLLLKRAIDLMQLNLSSDNQYSSLFISLLLAYGIAWSACEVLIMVRVGITFKAISHILTDMISHTVNKFIDLNFVSNSNKKTGEIISIIGRLQASLPQFLDGLFVQVLPVFLQIILVLTIVTISFDLTYSFIMLGVMATCLTITVITANKTIKYQISDNAAQNKFSSYLLDTLQHFDTIKYFNNEVYEKNIIKSYLLDRHKSYISIYNRYSWIGIIQNIVVGIGLLSITLKSGYAVINHQMSIGGFILLNSYIMQFSMPLSNFGFIIQAIKRTYVDIIEFVELTNKIQVTKDAVYELPIANPDIEFRNVSYYYEEGKYILKDISFKIPYGERIAILGKTGSGKSTIIKLLLKFIVPTSGKILIGGQDILDIPQSQLIRIFGVVPQDCALFNRSIYDNIRYGKIDVAEEDIQRLINLLHLSHLRDHGDLGERSVKVSGGEKQRIAIARAFLKNPSICIFDEFTSSLDSHTEQMVLGMVDDLFKNCTIIMIAHKLHTIKNADKTIYIKEGAVVIGKSEKYIN